MATLQINDFKRVARKFGATLYHSYAGRYHSYNIDAPHGKLWSASDTHTLVVEWRKDDPVYKHDAIADVIERMEEGLHDCDVDDCDFCAGE